MMYGKATIRIISVFFGLALLCMTAGTAAALTNIYLRAEATTLTLPDGAVVPMWGFARDTAFGAMDGVVSVPGPVLRVLPGETVLHVHLDNNLPEPISLNINGLRLSNNSGPVFSEPGGGAVYSPTRPAGNFTARVRSFGHETPPNNAAAVIYEFTLRPGTFMYASGTNPAKQVQMGLYGALAVDPAAATAYPGVPYTKELVLVYSEVDPAIHAAIDAGNYGPAGTVTSSVNRDTKYYLINGMAYDAALPDGGGLNPLAVFAPGDRVLVRAVNAGYETHVPEFLNLYATVVAEDGNPYAYPKEQYALELPAGKTMDAIVAPTVAGTYSIHDAALHLTNNGTASMGGMLAYIQVGGSCVGDIDGDGIVNFPDLAIVRANFLTVCAPGAPCPGDLNGDGEVNFADLAIIRANFLTVCP